MANGEAVAVNGSYKNGNGGWIRAWVPQIVTWILTVCMAVATLYVSSVATRFQEMQKKVEITSDKVYQHDTSIGIIGANIKSIDEKMGMIRDDVKDVKSDVNDLRRGK